MNSNELNRAIEDIRFAIRTMTAYIEHWQEQMLLGAPVRDLEPVLVRRWRLRRTEKRLLVELQGNIGE